MKTPQHWPPSKWWVVRLRLFAEGFIPNSLLVSPLLFAMPLTVAGIIVVRIMGVRLFSRGVLAALAWLSAGPWLLEVAHRAVARFFDENRAMFLITDESLQDLQRRMLADLSSRKHLWMSIPFASVCVWVLLNSLYAASPTLVRVWITAMFRFLLYLGCSVLRCSGRATVTPLRATIARC